MLNSGTIFSGLLKADFFEKGNHAVLHFGGLLGGGDLGHDGMGATSGNVSNSRRLSFLIVSASQGSSGVSSRCSSTQS